MQPFLSTPIEYLKGVGPQRAELLKKELGIFTFLDLVEYYPFRYIDRSSYHKIKDIQSESVAVQLKGRVTNISFVGGGRSRRMVARFEDGSGSMELVWFKGIKWVKKQVQPHKDYIVFGKPSRFNNSFNIAHPEIEEATPANLKKNTGLQAVYSTTEKLSSKGLHSKGILKLQRTLLSKAKGQVPETLPSWLLKKMGLPTRETSMFYIHTPPGIEVLKEAVKRIKFEELFYLQLKMLRQKDVLTKKTRGYVFEKVGLRFNSFYNEKLPFELTGAQKRVLKEIRHDTGSGYHMNRLLQGDVGSGKTVVALMSMLLALDNGFQTCMMAPTEILANQHFESLKELLEGLDVKTALLTGSTKAAERKIIHEELQNGTLNILIGTHALIEETVKFKNLGLAVVDEQHRFGVAQRAKLWKKNKQPPHVLVMTATPIPRTLAMTVYGDLDVSLIDELPPGRKPVKTVHRNDASRLRVFGFMEEEIKKGRQIYVVYPLIEESKAMDYKDLMDGYESICKRFPRPQYQVSIVHGKMKPEDKDMEMERFLKKETQIMVATTVIEVGVNIPNASVMVIESAERFGLSQLHQLRGRVGRGAEQSYCILMTGDKISEDAKLRMRTMTGTNDGFKIAEVDLKLRGPGDLEGTQQSGILNLKLSDITKDAETLKTSRYVARAILEKDPDLKDQNNYILKKRLNELYKDKQDWSKIA